MIRAFEVRPVLNGYIVSIGCQTLVFNDRRNMVNLMDDYLKNPDEIEAAILKNACNAKHLKPDQPTECDAPPPQPEHYRD